jgi:exosortase D (VPLPA-CTERM-specific)
VVNLKNRSFPLSGILGALLVIALIWAYWPILARLADQLLTDEDYSFGLLLPLVSGYIAYLKWPEIRRGPWRPSWMGVAVLAAGMGLYILGGLTTDLYTPSVSFVVSLGGVLMLFGGWRLVRLLAFPLLLLFLMIPLPQFIIRQLTLPLQLVSSRLATETLQLVGIPAVRQGNIIDLGVRQLQIVSACSGLRYILALTALGIIFCYFYQRRPWKIGVLLLALLPAAILANALRVAGMGIWPVLQAVGFWHSFSGWLIFIFCFVFLSLLNWGLNYLQPEAPGESAPAAPAAGPAGAGLKSPTPYLAVALALVLVAGFLGQAVGRIPPVPLLQSFDKFPLQMGPWQGKRSYIDAEMFKATGASTYLDARFYDPTQGQVSLWIAYYENQRGGGSVHSPFSCLTGSGWSMVESGITDLAPGLPVRFMVMEQGGAKHLIYYWYLQRGRWLTSEYLNKFYLGYDGLFNRRADGALVRLMTPVDADVKPAQERLNAFAKFLVPALPQFMRY